MPAEKYGIRPALEVRVTVRYCPLAAGSRHLLFEVSACESAVTLVYSMNGKTQVTVSGMTH